MTANMGSFSSKTLYWFLAFWLRSSVAPKLYETFLHVFDDSTRLTNCSKILLMGKNYWYSNFEMISS